MKIITQNCLHFENDGQAFTSQGQNQMEYAPDWITDSDMFKAAQSNGILVVVEDEGKVTAVDTPTGPQHQYDGNMLGQPRPEEAFTTPVQDRHYSETPVHTASAAPSNVPIDQPFEDISAGHPNQSTNHNDDTAKTLGEAEAPVSVTPEADPSVTGPGPAYSKKSKQTGSEE